MYPVELRTPKNTNGQSRGWYKVRAGITDFAQSELGDVVLVELPDLENGDGRQPR